MSGSGGNYGWPCDKCGHIISFSFYHEAHLCSKCLWEKSGMKMEDYPYWPEELKKQEGDTK